VDVVLADTDVAPARDGGFLQAVGSGDRGCGLVYRAGRLNAAPTAAGGISGDPDDGGLDAVKELRVIKVQPPLDTSSDSQGGIGKMTQMTLLLHTDDLAFVHFVTEGVLGHTALMRGSLRTSEQVGYFWCKLVDGEGNDGEEAGEEAAAVKGGGRGGSKHPVEDGADGATSSASSMGRRDDGGAPAGGDSSSSSSSSWPWPFSLLGSSSGAGEGDTGTSIATGAATAESAVNVRPSSPTLRVFVGSITPSDEEGAGF
jgi:hypothetical protein